MGEPAVPALMETLKSKTPTANMEAARVLGYIGSPAVHKLITVLKDKDPEARRRAAVALSIMGRKAPAAFPEFLAILEDEDADEGLFSIAVSAARRFGEEGRRASEAAVVRRRRDKESAAQRAQLAQRTQRLKRSKINRIANDIKNLKSNLQTPSRSIHARSAILEFGKKKPVPAEVAPTLISALEHKDERVRATAAEVLGKIDPTTKEIKRALVKALGDEEAYVQGRARLALMLLKVAAVPELIEGLQHENPTLQNQVFTTLRYIGPAAKDAIEPLNRILKSKSSKLRIGAALTLSKIGSAAVPTLVSNLEDKDSETRRLGAFALQRMGAAAKQALPALKKAANDKDPRVRDAVQKALQAIESGS
jgi:HEAT repeat protein